MPRRRRNMILIRIIGLGLLNFLTYTVGYAYIGGDAKNGRIEDGHYYVVGHYLHRPQGWIREVSASVWIYSYLHSISIWPTICLVLCSMLILAKPHIIATVPEDGMMKGTTFVTASMTIIVIITGASMIYFIVDFIEALNLLQTGHDYGLGFLLF